MNRRFTYWFSLFCLSLWLLAIGSSCANIVPPTGGPRDTLPPILLSASPRDSSTGFNANKITLEFDEYVTVENAQENLVVWPNPKNPPVIENKLRTVTIRLKDSLEPATTYTLLFGNAIKDVNEGNANKNFSYEFSTGTTLADNVLKGNVKLAQSGKTDSTLLVVLHTNLTDTAIEKTAPRYYAKLDGKGNFRFFNLPTDTFNVFVVPNDYTKRYDDSTKLFAFLPAPVYVQDTSTAPLTLYAYQEVKATPKRSGAASSTATTRKGAGNNKDNSPVDSSLKITTNLNAGKQDFLKNLVLTFSDTLQSFDSTKFHFSDTNFVTLPGATITPDTSADKLILSYNWKENTPYKLVVEKEAVIDSAGNTLTENDTLSFYTMREAEYGSIRMRFQNLDTSRHPVLQLVQNDNVVQAVRLTNYEWYQQFILPGEYELRLLLDENENGVWDAGSYAGKRLPEVVKQIETRSGNRINIRANWDNEENITL